MSSGKKGRKPFNQDVEMNANASEYSVKALAGRRWDPVTQEHQYRVIYETPDAAAASQLPVWHPRSAFTPDTISLYLANTSTTDSGLVAKALPAGWDVVLQGPTTVSTFTHLWYVPGSKVTPREEEELQAQAERYRKAREAKGRKGKQVWSKKANLGTVIVWANDDDEYNIRGLVGLRLAHFVACDIAGITLPTDKDLSPSIDYTALDSNLVKARYMMEPGGRQRSSTALTVKLISTESYRAVEAALDAVASGEGSVESVPPLEIVQLRLPMSAKGPAKGKHGHAKVREEQVCIDVKNSWEHYDSDWDSWHSLANLTSIDIAHSFSDDLSGWTETCVKEWNNSRAMIKRDTVQAEAGAGSEAAAGIITVSESLVYLSDIASLCDMALLDRYSGVHCPAHLEGLGDASRHESVGFEEEEGDEEEEEEEEEETLEQEHTLATTVGEKQTQGGMGRKFRRTVVVVDDSEDGASGGSTNARAGKGAHQDVVNVDSEEDVDEEEKPVSRIGAKRGQSAISKRDAGAGTGSGRYPRRVGNGSFSAPAAPSKPVSAVSPVLAQAVKAAMTAGVAPAAARRQSSSAAPSGYFLNRLEPEKLAGFPALDQGPSLSVRLRAVNMSARRFGDAHMALPSEGTMGKCPLFDHKELPKQPGDAVALNLRRDGLVDCVTTPANILWDDKLVRTPSLVGDFELVPAGSRAALIDLLEALWGASGQSVRVGDRVFTLQPLSEAGAGARGKGVPPPLQYREHGLFVTAPPSSSGGQGAPAAIHSGHDMRRPWPDKGFTCSGHSIGPHGGTGHTDVSGDSYGTWLWLPQSAQAGGGREEELHTGRLHLALQRTSG